MSDFRKTSPDDLYFVTLTIEGWVDLFSRKIYKDIIVENLEYCQKNEGLEIYSYVIMTNHLHLICRRRDHDLNELIGRFKSYTSKKILIEVNNNPQESRKEWLIYLFQFFARKSKQYSQHHVWHYSNHPTVLFSAEVANQKRDYIHQNPVRAGIVNEESSYLYSSACLDSPLKICEW